VSYRIESLTKQHVRDAFDCGEDSLNDFLRRFARQNDERGLGRSFVAVTPDDVRICGYYTLASGAVAFDTMPEKLPRYPVPVAHLGRLAVDRTAQGRGLGAFLLVDALKRVLKTADQIGLYAVEVYALNAQAKAFYLKYGFQPLLDDPFHLYLSIKTVRKLGLN
jgi:GNAT superfamily N-acetyltransferase